MTELSYHEDLFNNTTSGYLMLVDSLGYIEKLSLTGNEFIRMTFGKTTDTITLIDKIFRVYKVDNRKLESNMNSESYCLYFCSEELILSEQYKISKSYRGKSIYDNVTEIVENVLQVPSGKYSIDPTYGVYDFVIPNLKPFDAINFMSVYARPTPDKPGADMLFYEDRDGYKFKSIQSMMAGSSYHDYTFNPKNLNRQKVDLMSEAHNVLTYEVMDSYDALGAINSGIFANRLISVDPILRRFKTTDFNYADYITKYNATTLNSHPITNNFVNRKGDGITQTSQSVMKLVFSNFNQLDSGYVKNNPGALGHDIFAETYIPWRTAQLHLSTYTRIKISIPGDSNITVGRVINFSILSKDPTEKVPDKSLSGRYLVTAVRHLLNFNEYKTILEIAKESSVSPQAMVLNGTPTWNYTVQGLTKK